MNYINRQPCCFQWLLQSTLPQRATDRRLCWRKRVLINNFINEIAEELELMPQEEHFSLHTHFNEDVIINGNISLIGSIFRNLTENAIAYSSGSNIYISLLENNDEFCWIRFEDDGCGVDAKQLPRLSSVSTALTRGVHAEWEAQDWDSPLSSMPYSSTVATSMSPTAPAVV